MPTQPTTTFTIQFHYVTHHTAMYVHRFLHQSYIYTVIHERARLEKERKKERKVNEDDDDEEEEEEERTGLDVQTDSRGIK
jgi:hypothetical protein